jgi:hypothetical protein
MKRMRVSMLPLVAGLLAAASCLLGCGGQELASTWRDRGVMVDGQDTEWEGALAYLSDENMAIGMMNDEQYLYLCVATVDSRLVRQVVGSGLTIWFDPRGGKKKEFGINFPLGMALSSGDSDIGIRPALGSLEGGPDPEKIREMLEASAKEMAIIGPGENERRLMPVAGSQEVKVKLGYAGGKLVYEMRIPLVRDLEHPDAIGLEDGDNIGLGFETAEIDMGDMKGRMRSGMGSGGPPGGGMRGGEMRGGGGGMRGGGAPGGRGPGGGMPERLQLWTKVLLASTESAALTLSGP